MNEITRVALAWLIVLIGVTGGNYGAHLTLGAALTFSQMCAVMLPVAIAGRLAGYIVDKGPKE